MQRALDEGGNSIRRPRSALQNLAGQATSHLAEGAQASMGRPTEEVAVSAISGLRLELVHQRLPAALSPQLKGFLELPKAFKTSPSAQGTPSDRVHRIGEIAARTPCAWNHGW